MEGGGPNAYLPKGPETHSTEGLLAEILILVLSGTASERREMTRTGAGKVTILAINSDGKTRQKSIPPNYSHNKIRDPDQESLKSMPEVPIRAPDVAGS